jgi:geranylgeranyl pyrophosphate synthase/predicted secreted hydrolase
MKVTCSSTMPVSAKSGQRTLGYGIETVFNENDQSAHSNSEKIQVVRTEETLKAFHQKVCETLKKQGVKDPAKQLDFPLKEYRTGLEFVPSIFFFVVWYATHFHMGVEQFPAAMMSLAGASLVMVSVIAFGLVRFPTMWSGKKRLGPITEYLSRVVEKLGKDDDLVKSLLLPDIRPDWPSKFGSIDLEEHDLPHDTCSTEWWYFNSHFQVTDKETGDIKPMSFFASFFRIVKHVDSRGRKYFGHALTWAIVDPNAKEYYFDVALDKDAPKDILTSMEKSAKAGPSDAFVRRALMDILRKGNVPLPDRLMKSDASCSNSSLKLNYDGSTLEKDPEGRYVLNVNMPSGISAKISFKPEKAPVRHGDNGIVKGHENENEDMFYYFIPRCSVTGTIDVPVGKTKTLTKLSILPGGQGWYDHEFGGVPKTNQDQESKPTTMDYAWNWVAVQLNEPKMEISAAVLLEPRARKILEIKAVVVGEDGTRTQFDGLADGQTALEEIKGKVWTSVRSFRKYPVSFNLRIPAMGLDLTLDASAHPDQEFMTLLSKPAFWEGRIEVSGKLGNKSVSGLGFLERNGFDPDQNINQFFKNVGIAVRDSVEAMYPLRPTLEEAIELIATKETAHYCDGVPLDILGDTLIAPVRAIADRGGKSWRSYAALACVDAVGGDSRKFVQWVAMPEFLHVGSLIVDDIQDRSETRRGGPCAHLIYGEPLSINAGTAAYFQCEQMLSAPGLSDADQIKCYKLYFAALRGGHAGQALDIHGNDYMMEEVVETGDASLLEKRICAIHRLKTAVPAGTLARMGCTVGGGTDAQVEAVGRFMEAVGVAFQIMDDVLNLRGIYSSKADKKAGTMLKTLGEDIVDGKVTMPVCMYMGLMKEKEKRREIWETIKSKPQDPAVVQEVIDELERVGAVQACVDMSNAIVDDAWKLVDRQIPDSFSKMMLRSFGWFVTEQSGG